MNSIECFVITRQEMREAMAGEREKRLQLLNRWIFCAFCVSCIRAIVGPPSRPHTKTRVVRTRCIV